MIRKIREVFHKINSIKYNNLILKISMIISHLVKHRRYLRNFKKDFSK